MFAKVTLPGQEHQTLVSLPTEPVPYLSASPPLTTRGSTEMWLGQLQYDKACRPAHSSPSCWEVQATQTLSPHSLACPPPTHTHSALPGLTLTVSTEAQHGSLSEAPPQFTKAREV